MTQQFTAHTPLAPFEALMQQCPNFRKKGGGRMAVPDLKTANLTHGELAHQLAKSVGDAEFIQRTRKLLPPRTATPFLDPAHQQRMNALAAKMNRDNPAHISAAFLLSATPKLWARACKAVGNNGIIWSRIPYWGLDWDEGFLRQAAEDLSRREWRIPLDELCDPKAFGDNLFRSLVSAFVLRRYGWTAEPMANCG